MTSTWDLSFLPIEPVQYCLFEDQSCITEIDIAPTASTIAVGLYQPAPSGAREIDEYAHVNNTVYLKWLIGLPGRTHQNWACRSSIASRFAVAWRLRHTRVDYLEAALLDDSLLIATWLVACDGRLRCTRRFEIVRVTDSKRAFSTQRLNTFA